VLAAAQRLGASTTVFTGPDIAFPPYFTGAQLPPAARDLIESVRRADGVVIASPGYHGTISGVVKNALDYLEELRDDARPYLDGRAVGLVAVARGWQATVDTLVTLRQVTHALRGWPTPYGVTINSSMTHFDDDLTEDDGARDSLELVAAQVVSFARKMGTGSDDGR
jgi:FMN reductase